MKTLNYVGRGWWSGSRTKYKKAEEAIKVYGKTNVSRIGPGVWLCVRNNEPVELILMHKDEQKPAAAAPKTKIIAAAPKAKVVAAPAKAASRPTKKIAKVSKK